MKKFKSLFAFLIVALLGVSAFADEHKAFALVRDYTDDTHLGIRILSHNTPSQFTVSADTKFYNFDDEPIKRPDYLKLLKENIEILICYNDNNEISEFYVMKPGLNSHEYYRGKALDIKIVEGTYKRLFDTKLTIVPYGSKSIVEYYCPNPKVYNENNIEIRNSYKALAEAKKVRVVLEEGPVTDRVLDIYVLPLQYDFATKTIGGKSGSAKVASVDDDGWGSDDDEGEEGWDGWSDTESLKFDYTITEGYGYIKKTSIESITIARKDGKYKNFEPKCGGSRCISYKIDGKKTAHERLQTGQYCRYLVKKYNDTGEEGIIELRVIPEGTKFDQDRYVPDNLTDVEINYSELKKDDKTICRIRRVLNKQYIECQMDENTRFYDENQRQTTYKDIVAPYKATTYEKDGKIYLYALWAEDSWTSVTH